MINQFSAALLASMTVAVAPAPTNAVATATAKRVEPEAAVAELVRLKRESLLREGPAASARGSATVQLADRGPRGLYRTV